MLNLKTKTKREKEQSRRHVAVILWTDKSYLHIGEKKRDSLHTGQPHTSSSLALFPLEWKTPSLLSSCNTQYERQKHKVLHITCPHTTPPHFWLLCPVLVGKTRLTQEKIISISLSFTRRDDRGHCPDTQQGPVQKMGRSIPSLEPSTFLKHVNKFCFYTTLHPRFQNCYQKWVYYFYSLSRKTHEEWHQTKEQFNSSIESSLLTSLLKIP